MSQTTARIVKTGQQHNPGRMVYARILSICATAGFLLLRHEDGGVSELQVDRAVTIMHRTGRHELGVQRGSLQALFVYPSPGSIFMIHVETAPHVIIVAVNEQVRVSDS